jgi:hypothetical protein
MKTYVKFIFVLGFIIFISLLFVLIITVRQNNFVIPKMIASIDESNSKLPIDLKKNGRNSVFYGMVKNGMPGIKKAKKNIISLAFFFEMSKFVILEDGSTDGTREFLEEWQTQDTRLKIVDGDSIKAQKASNVFQKKLFFDKNKGPKRIAKYCVLRNQLQTEVVKIAQDKFENRNVFVSMDLDQNLSIDKFNFFTSLTAMETDELIVASSAHGLTVKFGVVHLYDTYAFVDDHIQKHDLYLNDFKKFNYINSLQLDDKTRNVISNFGGLSIYRNTERFRNNYYSVDFHDELRSRCMCEHVGFHRRLKASNKSKHLILFKTFFY